MDQITQDRVVEAIGEATAEVFSTMLLVGVKPAPSYIERTPSRCGHGVVSLVGFAGAWVGTGGLACSAEFACKLYSRMLMADVPAVNEEVLDAAGEVASMIVGSFKTRLEDYLGPMRLSIPSVIYGRNFAARSVNSGEWIVVPFDCDGSTFQVKVCMAPHASNGVRVLSPISASVVA